MLVLGDLYVVVSPERLGPALEEMSYEPSHDAVHDLWQACEDVLAMQVVRSISCSGADSLTQRGGLGSPAFPNCAWCRSSQGCAGKVKKCQSTERRSLCALWCTFFGCLI